MKGSSVRFAEVCRTSCLGVSVECGCGINFIRTSYPRVCLAWKAVRGCKGGRRGGLHLELPVYSHYLRRAENEGSSNVGRSASTLPWSYRGGGVVWRSSTLPSHTGANCAKSAGSVGYCHTGFVAARPI